MLGAKLDGLLRDALEFLTNDAPLPPRFVDHALAGAWKTYRDRQIRLDLILIYRKMGSDVLELARLGSHSELGL